MEFPNLDIYIRSEKIDQDTEVDIYVVGSIEMDSNPIIDKLLERDVDVSRILQLW